VFEGGKNKSRRYFSTLCVLDKKLKKLKKLAKRKEEEEGLVLLPHKLFIIDLLAAFSSKEKERQKNDSARSFIAG
jgi:hypothetical protein